MRGLPAPIGVYAILDTGTMPAGELSGAAAEMAASGVRVFQVRAKKMAAGAFARLVLEVRAALPERAVVIVNDRADVALVTGADGVHVGGEDLPPALVRRMLPAGGIVGFSTHSVAEAAAAVDCDYVGFGPVFHSGTKAAGRRLLGVDGVAEACRVARVPVAAIGGIDVAHVKALARAGASGVAMISGLLARGRPGESAARAVEEFGKGLAERR